MSCPIEYILYLSETRYIFFYGFTISCMCIVPSEMSNSILCSIWYLRFLLLSQGRYFCWWTIRHRGYHPPSS